ncbi:MFS transporter [Saccharomonospora halophila]|uniref:MFS transporter n=1 Tax=Saccharomonospora halophila TaxID=129922 RepID=UPI00048C5D07|nr:MFS transporter [Saccharomonospora halophila]
MQSTAPAGRREWAGLAVLTLPTVLLSMDISVLYVALPHLSTDLGANATQQLWILDIYSFLLAGFLVTMGTLGDRIGRRKLLFVGAVAFAAASALAAYSTSAEMLIATRAIMGVAGATLMPSTLALISNMFRDPKQQGVAIALWASCLQAGGALGPVVGGVLLQSFGWGAVFLVAVPIMALLLIAGPFLLPEYRDTNAGRLDLTSVALSLAALLPVIYGVKELARSGVDPLPVAAVVTGVAFGVVFGLRQRRLTSPLLDLRLFANPRFSAALGIMLIAGAGLAGIFLPVSQYVQLVEGHSPMATGLWLIPVGASIGIGAMVAPKVAEKVRPRGAIGGGLALSVVGFVLLTLVGPGTGMPALIPGIVLIYLGAGPAIALGTGLVVGSVEPDKAGSAASMSETSNQLGAALGIAAFGAIATAAYQSRISVPGGVAGDTADTARVSLADATSAADDLPAGQGGQLLDAAHEAFTGALTVSALVGGAVFLILAFVAAKSLRDVDPAGRSEATREEETHDADSAHVPQQELD